MGDLKEILPIVFERANAAATLWNYELTIILSGLAFLVAASNALRSKLILAGLPIGYFLLIRLTRQPDKHGLFVFRGWKLPCSK
jgi:hypothetical protein